LDLLVPHWQEAAKEMEPLLDSVKVQQQVDFSDIGVIIAYDGPEASELPLDEWRERYPFAIEDVHPEKGGVSATRNAAFDASRATYVMWCDADDMFCDACGMYLIFHEMDAETPPQDMMAFGLKKPEKGFDVLISVFREETKGPDGSFTFINHDQLDTTFCHGKAYRRQYLIDKNLKYNSELFIHEDSFFQILARECAKPYRAKFCPMPFYLWKWRDSSVCRHDPDYILKTMPNMIASNSAVTDEFIRRGMTDKAAQYFVMMCFEVYYMLNKPEWLEKTNSQYRDKVEKDFVAHFRAHRELWDDMSNQEKMMISQGVRQRSVAEGMLMEALTCPQWLDRILEKYPA